MPAWLKNWLKIRFVAGFFVTVPAIATAWLLWIFWSSIDDFFAPLDGLDVGDTKVFLGIIHHTDGIDAFRRRRDLAGKHLSSFGIASVCGYGRVKPEKLPEILRIHAQDAKEL